VDFETYLTAKKIDSIAFRKAEPQVWQEWSSEFDQMHPDSFTMQKLNLINPIRRKYTLQVSIPKKEQTSPAVASAETGEIKPAIQSPAKPKPIMAKPVFKPKPKT